MRISSIAAVTGDEAVCRVATWRWLMPLLLGVACVLQGCDAPPAPTPTPNPQPQHVLKLKITVEKSEVNRVEVRSMWSIGNIGCAPTVWPGYQRIVPVNVSEPVEKVGDDYIATIVMDRFLPGECHWRNGGPSIYFFHDDYRLSSDGANREVLSGAKIEKVTCLTRPFSPVGGCGLRDEESFYKNEDKNAFNASVELMK
jgi:hypothetical protein